MLLSWFTGAYSHAGPIVTAFAKSKHQPKDVGSPYLQYVLLNNMMNAEGHRNNIGLKTNVSTFFYSVYFIYKMYNDKMINYQ